MSINHHSYNSSDPHWWSSHHMMQQITTTSPPKTSSSSSKHDEQQQQQRQQQNDEIPKEPMFEKSLTPSDVGKLNRLVIPKQYAEKYFPLNGLGHESNDQKGLLLSFEDEVGKTWRFRYSYWNSSQSYVLTKGWSRFVKEKKLEAGDVVLFLRDRLDHGCLFIGWRRKNDNLVGGDNNGVGVQNHGSSSLTYQPDQFLNAGSVLQNQTTPRSGNSKRRLRLFGVNLECQVDESEPSTPDDSQMSSQLPAHQYTPYHYQY